MCNNVNIIGSYAQKWYISHLGNGEYMICSDVGSDYDNGTIYLNYALDVDNGTNANGTNIHIWNVVTGGTTQTYSFSKTGNSTYIIYTKASNYTKVVSLADNLCDNGINVHQWEYSNHSHDQWILEPVDYYKPNMGADYAKANYNQKVDAYPELFAYADENTNFVSQCLLAGGWHQTNDWKMKRKNTTYQTVLSQPQLNESWNASDSWITGMGFYNKFYTSDRRAVLMKGSLVYSDLGRPAEYSYSKGDVVQFASLYNGTVMGPFLNTYITLQGVSSDSDGNTYTESYVTYPDHRNMSLSSLANSYSDYYLLFYDFTS